MKTISPIMPLRTCSIFVVPVLRRLSFFYLKWRIRLPALPGCLFLLFSVLTWLGFGAKGQEIAGPGEARFLPPSNGEALTLMPHDMPDMSCSVVDWKDAPPIPTLAMVCPPQDTFAPLHVYLKLSWLRSEDVPQSAHRITAPANTLIKVRTNKSTALVLVGVRERLGAPPRKAWVAFNGVVDLALLTLPPRR